ncbi:N/A [soil metagenome]
MNSSFSYGELRGLLQRALDLDWDFVSFKDFYNGTRKKRILLLRHDLDQDLEQALRIAEIEHEMGISATYFFYLRSNMYNLLSSPNLSRARKIIELGHYAGLHFDETAYPTKGNGLDAHINREASILSSELGAEVTFVSFHQPSEALVQGNLYVETPHTYRKDLFHEVVYRSDSSMDWRHGIPYDILDNPENRAFQLLIHPEAWAEEGGLTKERRWDLVFKTHLDGLEAHLLTTERSYIQKRVWIPK